MPLLSIFTAFGLSSAAGLNAYIPLFIIAILGRMHVIPLSAPYDVITQWWAIIMIGVLLAAEIVIDKIPAADHVNDVIQTVIRPATGALLFAATSGLTHLPPSMVLFIGLLPALGVHATKATVRPVVNATTAGFGAPVASTVENVLAITSTFLAIFLPVVFMIFAVLVIFCVYRFYRWLRLKRAILVVSTSNPTPVET